MLDTLRLTAEFLTSVRGRRKAVLFFSEGIDYPILNSFGGQSASDVIRATQDAITMAARANVNFHTIDPRGLVGMTNEFMEMAGNGAPELAGGAPMRTATGEPITGLTGGTFNAQSDLMTELMLSQGSLRELAEQTGGIAAVNMNSLTDAYTRIVEANSRYYVLGYYPPTHPRDGRFHKIRGQDKAAGTAHRRAQRLRVAARPHCGRAEARRRGAARSGGAAAECRQDVGRAARDAHQPAAAERSQFHGAGGVVQEHARRKHRSRSRSRSTETV